MKREDVLQEAARVAALFEAIGERESATIVRAAVRLASPPPDPQAPPARRIEYAVNGTGDEAVYAFVLPIASPLVAALASVAAELNERHGPAAGAWSGIAFESYPDEGRCVASVRGLHSFDLATREFAVRGISVREEAAYHRALPTTEAILADYWRR